jgi:hypothetical protein
MAIFKDVLKQSEFVGRSSLTRWDEADRTFWHMFFLKKICVFWTAAVLIGRGTIAFTFSSGTPSIPFSAVRVGFRL